MKEDLYIIFEDDVDESYPGIFNKEELRDRLGSWTQEKIDDVTVYRITSTKKVKINQNSPDITDEEE